MITFTDIIPWVVIALILIGLNKLKQSQIKKTSSLSEVTLLEYASLACARCKGNLKIEEMLDAAYCFCSGAIVFDCKHCNDRVYFCPYETFIETGTLAAAPVINTIPFCKYEYPIDFDMLSDIKEGVLNINIGANSWHIKSSSQIK